MFIDLWSNFFTWCIMFLEFGRQVYDIFTMAMSDLISLFGDTYPLLSGMTDLFSSIVEFFADDMSLIDLMFGPVGVVFVINILMIKFCVGLVLKAS